MSRPHEWWPLAGGDPVPGDPDELAALGRHMAAAAAEIERMATLLPKICTSEVWDSDAGQQFRDQAASTAAGIGRAHHRFFTVATALGSRTHGGRGYAAQLQDHQDVADAAVSAVNGTAGQAGSEDDRRSTWTLLLDATDGADPAAAPPAPATHGATPAKGPAAGPMPQASPGSIPPSLPAFPADTARVAALKQRYNAAIQQLHTSAGQISQATAGVSADAGTAAQLIRTAIDTDGLKNPSGFMHWLSHTADDVGHFLATHWAQFVADLANVAGVIATVCGILAMVFAFIPGMEEFAALFETVALLAQALALVCHMILLATGHGSWLDVMTDVIGLATFSVGKGLIGGAEATADVSRAAAAAYRTVAGDGASVPDLIGSADVVAETVSREDTWSFMGKLTAQVKDVISVRPVFSAALQAFKDGKLGAVLGEDAASTLIKGLKAAVGMSSPEIGAALSEATHAGQAMPWAAGMAWLLSSRIESYGQLFRITQGTGVGVDLASHLDQILHRAGLDLPGYDNLSSALGPGGG